MNFYELSADVFQWEVKLAGKKLHEVIVPINEEIFIEDKELPIKMELIDSYENIGEWEGETPFVDIIRWSDDFTLGSTKPRGGALLIISNKVKKIIEKYNLPPHQFYPVEIKCKYVKETRSDYFLLHMIEDKEGEIVDFEKCTFKQLTRNEKDEKITIETYSEGIIKSRFEFTEAKMGRNERISLHKFKDYYGDEYDNYFEYDNQVYKYNYDVLWGTPSFIFVSEEIKRHIEEEKCTNSIFTEVSHNMIRAFEYEKNKNKES
ncbi:hypothetical protein [Tenacibaculum agarivorans]|uniref:hypothetical protein n=1 Tax=Tenacibaculum agarivorans TaxID=1908389 RepID=UPI00094B7ADA|nr:hypothetical protein [Tenacibaculum agarivorans]